MRLKVKFNQTSQRLPVQFRSLHVVSARPEVDYYEGAYEVTPKIEMQQLETKQKFLTDDIKIGGIPFFNVSNTSGGSTVYIGKEVD